MTTNLPPRLLAAAAALLALSGCSNIPSLSDRRVTVGTLKSHVARLETENDQLRRELADKEADRSRLESELAQAESSNGELTARLDDARQALRAQGGDPEALATPSGGRRDPSSKARTAPASDPRRPGRRRPFAEIPGRITPAPASPDADSSSSPDLDRTSHWQPSGAPDRTLR